ncbi:chromosome partitioning ATPase protein-like protein [Methanohalobium evestigatum Z-7303]|uniref:Chromosome partitioning ATPase protein-like protein n=1 Tax=Methanohalobium evestigatum (strain ATCC BAA-1072 / DSM 3721 / NBRC 107634 / OCM 161 / Z-7303) TaxID=644295 RepID=D7EBM7_METEZ|nr:AAA family ATPase [Methanohalobium evestigatum]ADI74869.1 chromosome partitioning ATPase protein-like protein [Methanohalobium evestigatum Z-7303]
MSFTLAVHSSKGGTGKTSIAINLAGAYASEGYNVCLLDFDFKAPSFTNFFKIKPRYWINDVLHDRCSIKDAVNDISNDFETSGHLYVGLTDPDIESIREISSKDRDWQSKALRYLIRAKKELIDSGIDIVILDTSPGIDYESINAVATSDYIAVVVKQNYTCIKSTEQVIDGIYNILHKNCAIIENMCHDGYLYPKNSKNQNTPVIESIPCMCDITAKTDNDLIVFSEPDHVFSRAMYKISQNIIQSS